LTELMWGVAMNKRMAWVGNIHIEPWLVAIVVICLLILVVGFFSNQRTAPPARAAGPQRYAAQMDALDIAYKQGKQVREKMLAHKIRPTRARCAALYKATAASDLGSAELEAGVEPFYVAGCLDQKRLK
jgi:predicted ABC-type sugar transport system permease subunit